MSGEMDPAKLKVLELRSELTARGLDSKGIKAVLVKRLKDALEKELEQEIPDTSIVDTSTEDLNSSQESGSDDVQSVPPDKKVDVKPSPVKDSTRKPENMEVDKDKKVVTPKKTVEAYAGTTKVSEQKENQGGTQNLEGEVELSMDSSDACTAAEEENGENLHKEQRNEESSKSESTASVALTSESEKRDSKTTSGTNGEQRGDKRRRTSPSPERSQRRRSKSPVKEDEPPIDNDKVQLNWYDCDLHLQIDKGSFLSAKPYNDGAFGYAWAGARATHGVNSGKVCFEVKITEELKWEDVAKASERQPRSRGVNVYRLDRRKQNAAKSTDKSKEKDKIATEKNTDAEKSKDKDQTAEAKPTETSEEKNEKTETNPEDKSANDETESKKDAEVEKDWPKTDESKADTETKQSENAEENKDSKPEETSSSESKPEPMEVEEVKVKPADIPAHLLRVGWSTVESNLQLGEDKFSYGFDSTAKFVTDKQFTDYGVKFGVGDVIGAYLSIDDENATITYTVNGALQPVAITVPLSEFPDGDCSLFPHVLSRNYAFELNLGAKEEPWFPLPEELFDYMFLDKNEDKVAGLVRPETRPECEVIMMCGLPGSGKSHWVNEWIKNNAEKRYTIIGNIYMLSKMTVNGAPLKNSYKGRWNVILDKLIKCLNKLTDIAGQRRRNYIIDQTNVFPSAQRRKMRLFQGFKRRAVVVVVNDEEQAKRQAQQEAQDGKDVPDSAIFEMKANMSIPTIGDWLEEVIYSDLAGEEAKTQVQKYHKEGRDAGFGPLPGGKIGRDRGLNRWDYNASRRDYRGYRDNRGYQNRFDRNQQSGGWNQSRRPPSGNWNRDVRRDHRGPPSSGSRDWRNNNRSDGSRSQSRGNRDNRPSGGSFNRNQRSNQGSRPGGGNWQSGSWQQNQGNWNQGYGGGGGQGNWGQGQWGGGQGQQWKGYGQQGYGQQGSGWNYYEQYSGQNWNGQANPNPQQLLAVPLMQEAPWAQSPQK